MSFAALFSRRRSQEYHKVGQEGSDDPEAYGGQQTARSLLSLPRFGRWSTKSILAIVGGFAVLLFLAAAGHTQLKRPRGEYGGQRKLRIIAPADNPGTNLCKMLLSGYANGYPATVITNWHRDFSKGTDGFKSSHLGKIDGVLETVEGLSDPLMHEDERLSDDDIVFIVDAYDVWLQLPPQILLQRYYDQIEHANKRLLDEWHADAPGAQQAPKLDVIVSSQKKCWPKESDGHATRCDILPESTLRTDLYGPDTDKDAVHHLHDIRPRYINSGSIIGSVGGVKHYFSAAKKIVNAADAEGKRYASDQGVLGTLFGAQEAWRKQEREINARSADGEDVSSVKRQWTSSAEYGVGLDYVQDLSKPTVFEEDDGAYMILSDSETIRKESAKAGVEPPRIQGLPDDLANFTTTPLEVAGIRAIRDEDDDENPGWAEVPLYTDFWSEVVTVAAHHNAHRNGMKSQRLREWWSHNWFFPYLREVAELSQQPRALAPVAQVKTGGGKSLEFWAPRADEQSPMPRIFEKKNIEKGLKVVKRWDTLCSSDGRESWWDHVFQDGKGWKN